MEPSLLMDRTADLLVAAGWGSMVSVWINLAQMLAVAWVIWRTG